MHILGIYVHISARYEVSMINAVTGTAVHNDDTNDDDANDDDDNDEDNDT